MIRVVHAWLLTGGRIVPLWWSYRWRMWRLRLLTRRADPWEPGMREWLATQLPLITGALHRSRRG